MFEAVPSFQIEIAADTEDARAMIECGDFRGDQAIIDAHRAAMEHLAAAARTSGVRPGLPGPAPRHLRRSATSSPLLDAETYLS
jgi:hypothetical protein